MTSKNDITGDKLATKPSSEAYRDNWDRIFGKKDAPKFSGLDGDKEESTESKWGRMTNPKTVEDYAVTIPVSELTTAMIEKEAAIYELRKSMTGVTVCHLGREKKTAGGNPANKTDLVPMVEGILLAPTIGTARLVDNEDEGDSCD